MTPPLRRPPARRHHRTCLQIPPDSYRGRAPILTVQARCPRGGGEATEALLVLPRSGPGRGTKKSPRHPCCPPQGSPLTLRPGLLFCRLLSFSRGGDPRPWRRGSRAPISAGHPTPSLRLLTTLTGLLHGAALVVVAVVGVVAVQEVAVAVTVVLVVPVRPGGGTTRGTGGQRQRRSRGAARRRWSRSSGNCPQWRPTPIASATSFRRPHALPAAVCSRKNAASASARAEAGVAAGETAKGMTSGKAKGTLSKLSEAPPLLPGQGLKGGGVDRSEVRRQALALWSGSSSDLVGDFPPTPPATEGATQLAPGDKSRGTGRINNDQIAYGAYRPQMFTAGKGAI